MLKKILIFLACMVFISRICYAAEFEDYKWGESKASVSEKLREKGKKFTRTAFDEIKFKDTLCGSPCEVLLSFDEGYGLYTLWLALSGNIAKVSDIEMRLMDMLTARYGVPDEEEKRHDRAFSTVTYKWLEKGQQARYPDIRLHVVKNRDNTGSVFLEYSDAEYVREQALKRAGVL